MGVIYILTNPSFPQFVKIGYADNVEQRVRILNQNPGRPFSFRIYATYDFSERLENLKIHNIIDRFNPNFLFGITGGCMENLHFFFKKIIRFIYLQ